MSPYVLMVIANIQFSAQTLLKLSKHMLKYQCWAIVFVVALKSEQLKWLSCEATSISCKEIF